MNPDHVLVRDFMSAPTSEAVNVRTNPLVIALNTKLVDVRSGPGRVLLHFEPDELFIQGAGVLQGGAVSSMLDFAMSFSAMADLSHEFTVSTIALDVCFIRGAARGQFEASGWSNRVTKSVAFTQATLRSLFSNELIATASSTLAVRKLRPAAE